MPDALVTLSARSHVLSPLHLHVHPSCDSWTTEPLALTMGVTGLWTVLQPCARPIRIETLNKKRLAVDASIWIYQFLKAVRDKEGNALRNSHIVGFFRRICKLLFIGIQPVFVFDGGAPTLKRQTISNRKQRREGRREDAAKTATKLLAVQMRRLAEEEERKRREARRHPNAELQEPIPENLVYAEEVLQTQEERHRNRTFKRQDAYHLPDLPSSLSEMGGASDPRIMSLEELQEYARQYDNGEDINVYDFSKIDFDSPFFVSLPDSDRYNILNAARLRSRLRMGYSKDQLDTMFPDRMAFSKFQIERVRERNELTQRLMNINEPVDDAMAGAKGPSRVAGEKGREYVLVKNDGVEGGWALGVVSNTQEGQQSKPIDVDQPPIARSADDEEGDDDNEFEDVPIKGINRLPKHLPPSTSQDANPLPTVEQMAKHRKALYESRRREALRSLSRQTPEEEDPDSLFVPNTGTRSDEKQLDAQWDEEDEQFQHAIALSLQQETSDPDVVNGPIDNTGEVLPQQRADEPVRFSGVRDNGLAIARLANMRSRNAAPKGPFVESDSDEDSDLAASPEEAASSKPAPPVHCAAPESASAVPPTPVAQHPTQSILHAVKPPGFDGPLPFEKLNLGNSILVPKQRKTVYEDEGGFVKEVDEEEKKEAPLPPWFFESGRRIEPASVPKGAGKQGFEFNKADSLESQGPCPLPTGDAQISIIKKDSPSQTSIAGELPNNLSAHLGVPQKTLNFDGHLRDSERNQPSSFLSERPTSDRQGRNSDGVQSPEDSQGSLFEWSESDHESQKRVSSVITPHVDDHAESLMLSHSDLSGPKDDVMATEAPDASSTAELFSSTIEGAEDISLLAHPLPPTVGDTEAPAAVADDDSDVFSDPEDADLFASLAAEAEEHARFTSSLNQNAAPVDFDRELKQLRAQQKKDRRDADEVTQTMIAECQHLLTLFGLPYITAPMEAEAQCAELVSLGLVDGIVTDDSDTFLFGGNRVYKNMFNAAKFVECYLALDLVSEFALSRAKLIAISQLLGSDYTPGIPGIGPVTALEILSEFDTLEAFKTWWSGVQSGSIPKDSDRASPFRRRFRRSQLTKLYLPSLFPDPRVAQAYLDPEVDSDPQPFQWGVPDLDALRNYLSRQIGWSKDRTDEVLVPVIRDMNRREKEGTQSNITRFFGGPVGAGAFAPRVRDREGTRAMRKGKGGSGKRLEKALGKLAERGKQDSAQQPDGGVVTGQGGQDAVGESNRGPEETQRGNPVSRKRKKGKKAPAASSSNNDAHDSEISGQGSEHSRSRCSERQAPRKRARPGRRPGNAHE